MPNAARLVAALSLALVAFIASVQVVPLMPEGTDFGWFTQVNVAIGLIVGWVVMGKRPGRGLTPAINNGLTGMAVMVFWALFVQSTYEMIQLAMRHRYGGPFEAILGIFKVGMDLAVILMVPNIIATLLIGGVLAGMTCQYASKKWR